MTGQAKQGRLVVGGRAVASGEPAFVIAEAGVNHNGDPDLAHDLVDVAADAGADAVKFQTFDPRALVSSEAAAAPYQRAKGASSQLQMLEHLQLPLHAWRSLAAHAADRGLVFLSTPFDAGSLEILLELGVPALKVPSGELDNLAFIALIANCGKPLIISTGLGYLAEVRSAVEVASVAPAVALLHCVTAYPAPVGQSNLRVITTLREEFGLPVGWSDHTTGSTTAIAAAALGACIFEKHITTDRDLQGPDHAASANPQAFRKYVRAVREAESALGDGVKRPAEVELENRAFVRRSFHTTRPLPAGHRLARSDVELLRPADGLPASAQVVGRKLRRDLAAGAPVTEADLR